MLHLCEGFPKAVFNKAPSQVSSLFPGLFWKVIGDNEV